MGITFEIVLQAHKTKVYAGGEFFACYSPVDSLRKIKSDCANHAKVNRLHLVGFNVFEEFDGKRTTVELAKTEATQDDEDDV